LDYLHSDATGTAEIVLADGVHTYDFDGGGGIHGPIAPTQCNPEDCIYSGTLPFDLGSAFEASAAAQASGYSKAVNASAAVTFSLFEADGTTPVSFSPSTSAPEASTGAFL